MTRRRSWRGLLIGLSVALGALASARGQGVEPPPFDPQKRVYLTGAATLKSEDSVAATLARLDASSPERRFYLVVGEGSPHETAKATAAAWARAAGAWRADSNFVIAIATRGSEVAVLAPPALRDKLSLSPFEVEKLAARSFVVPAKRGELAQAVSSFAVELDKWLNDRVKHVENEGIAIQETPNDPPAPEIALGALSDRLHALEDRALKVRARGVDLGSIKDQLGAASDDLGRATIALSGKRPDLAQVSLKKVEDALDAASTALDRAESERALLHERAQRVDAELRRARQDLESVPAATKDLDHASDRLTFAQQKLQSHPSLAARALDEAQAALDQARAAVPAPIPPPVTGDNHSKPISLRRVLYAILALIPILLLGVGLSLREARAAARENLLLRRDQVARDARELRETLENLRERRDQVARPPRILIPLTLARDLGLAPAGATTPVDGTATQPAAAPTPASTTPASTTSTSTTPASTTSTTSSSPAVAATPETTPAPTNGSSVPDAPAPAPAAPASAPAPAASSPPSPADSAARRSPTESGLSRRSPSDSSAARRKSGIFETSEDVLGRGISSGRVRALEEIFVLPQAAAFQGETAALLGRANAAIAEVGAAWDSAEGALADAEGRALRTTFFGSAAFVEAREVLDLAPARVDLEARVELARTLVDRLSGTGELARAALATLRLEVAEAEEELDLAVASGLSPAAFEDDMASVGEVSREAVFASPTDPVRGAALAEKAVAQARRLREGLERALKVRDEIGKVSDSVSRLGDQVAQRGPLKEDDPSFLYERALASLAEAQSALELGVPEEAEKELARAREQVALAEEALGHREDAKAQGVAPLEERRTEAREAREACNRAREALASLEAEFARDSWEDVAPPLDAALRTLPLLEAELEQAAQVAAPENGRFTRTRVQLLRLDAHLSELRRTAASVERRLTGLRDDKTALPQRAQDLDRRIAEVRSLAREEEVALRADTHGRLDEVAIAVGRVQQQTRTLGERPDLVPIGREIEAIEVELDEVRVDIARDGFLCRRVLTARRAAELAVRAAEDARRRGRDRLAARAREQRARELLEKTEPLLARSETDWHVALDGYTCAIRAAYGARELASRKEGSGSCVRHALREARRALRAADRFDAAFVRVEVEPAQVLLRRALEAAEAGDEQAAVDHAERAAAAADEARRAALGRARALESGALRATREAARSQRGARERLDRKRLIAEAQRRAVWIGLRFGPPRENLSFEESSKALGSVEV